MASFVFLSVMQYFVTARRNGEITGLILFFLLSFLIIVFFIIGLNESNYYNIVAAAFTAIVLSTQHMCNGLFVDDCHYGIPERMWFYPNGIVKFILAKMFYCFLLCGLLLSALATLAVYLICGIANIITAFIVLLIGAMIIVALCFLGAAMLIGTGRSNSLAFIITVPLVMPVMGVTLKCFDTMPNHLDYLNLLLLMGTLLLPISYFLAIYAIKSYIVDDYQCV